MAPGAGVGAGAGLSGANPAPAALPLATGLEEGLRGGPDGHVGQRRDSFNWPIFAADWAFGALRLVSAGPAE